jgi:hypothetical protein
MVEYTQVNNEYSRERVAMAQNGWIKLHRCLIDKPIFDNPKLLKTLTWCLFKAAHKPTKLLVGRQMVELQPGQFVTGRNSAAKELKMKPSTAWDCIFVLKGNQTIDIKSNNKYSIVTVVNWATYQIPEEISDNKTDSKPNHKPDSKSDTNNKLRSKEVKKAYGDFVTLTPTEYQKLCDRFGKDQTDSMIENMNNWLPQGRNSKRVTDHYRGLLGWFKRDAEKEANKPPVHKIWKPPLINALGVKR